MRLREESLLMFHATLAGLRYTLRCFFLYTFGHNYDTWFQSFGWVSEYFCLVIYIRVITVIPSVYKAFTFHQNMTSRDVLKSTIIMQSSCYQCGCIIGTGSWHSLHSLMNMNIVPIFKLISKVVQENLEITGKCFLVEAMRITQGNARL